MDEVWSKHTWSPAASLAAVTTPAQGAARGRSETRVGPPRPGGGGRGPRMGLTGRRMLHLTTLLSETHVLRGRARTQFARKRPMTRGGGDHQPHGAAARSGRLRRWWAGPQARCARTGPAH